MRASPVPPRPVAVAAGDFRRLWAWSASAAAAAVLLAVIA